MKQSSIQNIILDLGGVIVNLDPGRSLQAFSELGYDRVNDHYSEQGQHEFFSMYETGKITSEVFIRTMQDAIPQGRVTEDELVAAWNAMILDLPPEHVPFLKDLGSKYRLFLLSNTNEIHIRFFYEAFERTFPGENFNNLFEQVFLSHRIGHRKPNADAFEYVLHTAGIQPSETLFIDDNALNIAGASQLGINTWFFQRNSGLARQWNSFWDNQD